MADAWLRGENGAVLTVGEPLPAGVAARLASGELSRIPPPARGGVIPAQLEATADQPSIELAADAHVMPTVPPPAADAKRGEWARYAISQGADPGEAWKMSRDALAARFGTQ